MVRALLANFVVVPALGVLLTRLIPMQPTIADAVVLLACSPGGISAVQFTSKRKQVVAFAGASAFIITALSVFLSPILLFIFFPGNEPLVVPYARAFWLVALLLLAPLALGVLVRERAEHLADQLAKPVELLGTLAFVVFVAMTLSRRQAATGALNGGVVAGMLGFIVITMIVGWTMGGPKRETRQVLASATSMRNVALCVTITTGSFPGAGIEVPLVAFSALMIPPNMIYTIVTMALNSRARRREAT
jgi:BASS family bile acid:Na+ symporter